MVKYWDKNVPLKSNKEGNFGLRFNEELSFCFCGSFSFNESIICISVFLEVFLCVIICKFSSWGSILLCFFSLFFTWLNQFCISSLLLKNIFWYYSRSINLYKSNKLIKIWRKLSWNFWNSNFQKKVWQINFD